MERGRLFGTDRAVYYLQAATQTLTALDGSREQAIRSTLEKFLSSPSTAFDKQIAPHVHQARDLNTNTRAFATWCQDRDAGRELCVVHAIYRKRNEAEYFTEKPTFNDQGEEWYSQFLGLTDADYAEFCETMQADDAVILVED